MARLPVLVLGMHRSGTSCLAGLLASAGWRAPGRTIRNCENPRGHFEANRLLRLNESVLAGCGGHWLAPPVRLTWDRDQATERDRLLELEGSLLKDPRSLLCLPFWEATNRPWLALGVVRHPLAVARSLAAWKQIPIAQGLALWLEHNRSLADLRRRRTLPLLDFDLPRERFLDRLADLLAGWGGTVPDDLAASYDPALVHHGPEPDGDPDPQLLAACLELHRDLCGPDAEGRPGDGSWRRLRAITAQLEAGAEDEALALARTALEASADPVGLLVPLASALLRRRQPALLADLAIRAEAIGAPAAICALMAGKAALAAGDPAAALRHLERACARGSAPWEARSLLPLALRRAGRRTEARASLSALVDEALYPHRPLSNLAEWCHEDGDDAEALALLRQAIIAAPVWRRGRLRSRYADLLLETGDIDGARRELELACREDPLWNRAQAQLARLNAPADGVSPRRPGETTGPAGCRPSQDRGSNHD